MATIAYARISTEGQSLDPQIIALKKAGAKKIYTDVESGSSFNRRALNQLIEDVRPGDVVLIYKLDRAGRSLRNLLELFNTLKSKGVTLRSLTENIGTDTPSGRLLTHFLAAITEYELDLIRERTRAGLKAAKEQGRIGGRPKAITPSNLNLGGCVKEACKRLSVSKSTLHRMRRRQQCKK